MTPVDVLSSLSTIQTMLLKSKAWSRVKTTTFKTNTKITCINTNTVYLANTSLHTKTRWNHCKSFDYYYYYY